MGHQADWLLAFAAGAVLAVMIHLNSVLATYSSALFASWFAHGIGAVVALLLVAAASLRVPPAAGATPGSHEGAPFWAYLGGIPGAFTVVLAAITVNGGLALSGTLALMLVGQVVFGLFADRLGWFGVARRQLRTGDLLGAIAVSSGSAILLFREPG